MNQKVMLQKARTNNKFGISFINGFHDADLDIDEFANDNFIICTNDNVSRKGIIINYTKQSIEIHFMPSLKMAPHVFLPNDTRGKVSLGARLSIYNKSNFDVPIEESESKFIIKDKVEVKKGGIAIITKIAKQKWLAEGSLCG